MPGTNENASGALLTHGGKTRKMQRICNAHQMRLCRTMQRIFKGQGEGREKERMPLMRRRPGPRKLISSIGARRSSATVPEGSSKAGSIALARAAIETASTKQDPREYIAACIHGPDTAAQR